MSLTEGEAARKVSLSHHLDNARFGPIQWRVVALCALAAIIDGFDINTMALAVPAIAASWGTTPASFGPVLSASSAGVVLGTIVFGAIGDRMGPARLVIFCCVVVGLTSIATAFTTSLSQLMLARLVTGLAMGGCMPNIITLAADYVGQRRAATAITLVITGIPLGGALGGYFAGDLVGQHGWAALFLVGGVLTLIVAVALAVMLPESLSFLVRLGRSPLTTTRLLAKVDPAYQARPHDVLIAPSREIGEASMAALFIGPLRSATVLTWIIFFFCLAGQYLIGSWLPSIFTQRGWDYASAAHALSYFQIGIIVGGLVSFAIVDRIGAIRVLFVGFLTGAIFVLLIAADGQASQLAPVLIFCAGIGAGGAQVTMFAFPAMLYPSPIRSTGVGWALGVGRLGAVVSPALGGLVIGSGGSSASAVLALVVACQIVCALGILRLGQAYRALRGSP